MVMEVQNDRIPFWKQYVSVIILLTNIVVFIFQLMDTSGYMLVDKYAFVPQELLDGDNYAIVKMFTAMFMHADFMHIIMNMWFFYVVADNCERAMGHLYFLITYFLSGIGASLLHTLVCRLIAFTGATYIPSLGASGAIMGLVAAYAVLFPNNRLAILSGYYWRRMSTWWFAFTYMFSQVIYGLGVITLTETSSVAYFAHIGGFIVGLILAGIYKIIRPNYKSRLPEEPKKTYKKRTKTNASKN